MPVVDDEGEIDYELVYGPRNADRLPNYLRFDMRASRTFKLDFGELSVFLEIINLTNRSNICCLDDFEAIENEEGIVEIEYKETYWAPFIPSIGVGWRF